MDPLKIIAMCFGACGSDDMDDKPRWMRDQSVQATANVSEKQILYHGMDMGTGMDKDHESPDDTADYVVSTIFSTGDNDTIAAALQRVRVQFEGKGNAEEGAVEMAAWWKEKVATRVFEGVFGMLRDMDLCNVDDNDDNMLGRINKQLAAMCAWVRETAPEIFEWTADYMADHKEEIAVAIACAAAVAVLWELTPWVLEALGFCFPGLRAGSVAARLMKKYMGTVPKGSWMSYFQRLGATWGRK